MTGEMLKGHLDMIVLSALEPEPAHGYAVIEAIRTRSQSAFDLPEGTVYPVLHRLETAQLLESAWDTSSGRKRRVYALTARGRRALHDQRTAWQSFADVVGKFVAEVPTRA